MSTSGIRPHRAHAFTGKHRFFMMMAICMGAFISHFTAGIVNVSLPQFTQFFQTDLGKVQWITTGYLLVITALLPVMGKMGDRYGFRRIHNLGYVFFTISSILLTFSTHISVLLVLRMVQAVGAAMFQATNIALITLHVPKENRGRALGIVSTAVALGAMTGPILGGWIAEWFSWQWLFLIHVPAAAAATLLAFRYIPVGGQKRRSDSFDKVGALLFMVGISSVIFGISNASSWGWLSVQTIFIFAAALITLLILLLWEQRQTFPFLPIRALRISAVSYGLIVSCASFMLANTLLVVIPFYLSGTAGLSPSTAGYMLAAYPITLALAGPVAGYLSDRYGSRRFMFLGLGGMGSGFALLALYLGQLPVIGVLAVLALIGLGMGLIASPNNSFIMKHAPAEHIGSIGSMIALTRNAGMVIGAALGLGVIPRGAGQPGQAELLASYQSVFEINLYVCIGVITLLGYAIHRDRKRRSQ
ncbi:MFS transporter [Paenibacillus eucommiae]|uniref:EmrB/QacA subfamily drug resistance transporter n=1 Tax=Paenibacillus eucommiae TaxID=1355755 RepID=A0ABS4INV0_9BACL|nr:MFS transporter [Paenibacillus eucommiae]MBP1988855.1 EmrB/QacA subfamily drug resistance transporter [Paenibacillus eucommiae]